MAGQRRVGEGSRDHGHEEAGGEHRHERADDGVRALIVDPPGRDPLVDDVRLLEEQLPRGDGGADDGDDEEYRRRVEPALHPGDEEAVEERRRRRMALHGEGDDQEVGEDEHEHEALPPPETPGGGHHHERDGRDRDRDVLAHAEVPQGQADADELRGDGEEVQDEEVADGEGAPEPAEALVDQPRVPDAGDGSEADHHLLVHDEYRDQQRQRPQQGQPVVLAGLGVGGDPAGIVVADHHDQAGAHDGEQGEDPRPPRSPGVGVVLADGPERPLDVADVGLVEDGGDAVRFPRVRHVSPPFAAARVMPCSMLPSVPVRWSVSASGRAAPTDGRRPRRGQRLFARSSTEGGWTRRGRRTVGSG